MVARISVIGSFILFFFFSLLNGTIGMETRKELDLRLDSDLYSVIVPTYNEKDNIPYLIYMLINEFKKNKIQFEIIVVDDNSKDKTAEVYQQLQKIFKEEKLLLLQRSGKLGLGTAYKEALKLVSGNFVILMDADLSHHPKYIYEFIKRQKETNCDIVTGSRYNEQGGVCGWTFKRIIVSRVANFLSQVLLFVRLTDLTGSFRLYKTDVLKEVMQHVQSKGYVFQMEVLVRAKILNKKIEEVGYVYIDRLYGSSKLAVNEIFRYLWALMKLFFSI